MKILIILFFLPIFAQAQVPVLNSDTTYTDKGHKTGVLLVIDAAYFPKLASTDTLEYARFDIDGKLVKRKITVTNNSSTGTNDTTKIPLNGTVVNKPVTGTIHFDNTTTQKVINSDKNGVMLIGNMNATNDTTYYTVYQKYPTLGTVANTITRGDKYVSAEQFASDNQVNSTMVIQKGGLSSQILINITDSIERIEVISTVPKSKGFRGNRYFGANYDSLTYVQKKYVDSSIATNTTTSLNVTKAQRDALVSPTQGKLVFVTDDGGYYSYYNNGWVENIPLLVSTKSANYTLTTADNYIDATVAGITLTLFSASGNKKEVLFTNSTIGSIFISSVSNIGNFTTTTNYTLATDKFLRLKSNGTSWKIINAN